MYTDKKNILELISLLRQSGIQHVVLCPGSRNAPLIQTFVSTGFHCYTVVDERSAGFFALGVIQKVNAPVVVCCTSGTALLNLSPAVAEAFYQELPLLVVSADRTAPWIGQMDGQTLPQPGVFGRLVKYNADIPEPATDEQHWYINRLINEALIALTCGGSGPVHINIPLAEPLFRFTAGSLPVARRIHYCEKKETRLAENYLIEWERFDRILIIAGQQQPDEELDELLFTLSASHNCVVLSEKLSNLNGKGEVLNGFDRLLYAMDDLSSLCPELLITFGGHVVSKRIKQFLRESKIEAHWHISPSGQLVDLYQNLTDVIKGDPKEILSLLARQDKERGYSYQIQWERGMAALELVVAGFTEYYFSDLYVTREFLKNLPSGVALQVGNSSAVRNIELFDIPEDTVVYCNRGTNGIEGSVSTAVGFSSLHQGLTFLLVGDLSFFYDMNGLWNKHLSPGLRILMINNGGGEIFHLLPGLKDAPAMPEYVAASHSATAQGWVESLGFNYLFADNEETLAEVLEIFTGADSTAPMFLEVRTDRELSAEVFRAYYRNLKQVNNKIYKLIK